MSSTRTATRASGVGCTHAIVLFGFFQFFFEGAVVGKDLVNVGPAAVEVDDAIGTSGAVVVFRPNRSRMPVTVRRKLRFPPTSAMLTFPSTITPSRTDRQRTQLIALGSQRALLFLVRASIEITLNT